MGDEKLSSKVIMSAHLINSRFDMKHDQQSNEQSLMDLGLNLLDGFLDVLCDEIENGDDSERLHCVLDAFIKQVELFADIQKQCGCDPSESLTFTKKGSRAHIEEFRNVVQNNINCQSGDCGSKMVRAWAKKHFYPSPSCSSQGTDCLSDYA